MNLADNQYVLFEKQQTSAFTLRENQGEPIRKAIEFFSQKKSKPSLIVLPTAWGKSILTAYVASVDSPCLVIVARQDKSPLYLIEAKCGTFSVPIYETDSEVMRRIKQFMAAYNIVDITMRMLLIREMIRITGFPDGYVLKGSSTNQKKFIGNAVPCLVPKAIAEALATELNRVKQIAV